MILLTLNTQSPEEALRGLMAGGLLACYVHITVEHNYLSWGGWLLTQRLGPDNMGVIFQLAITQHVDTYLI